MPKRIAVILGHPADKHSSLCEALAESYRHGAITGGHQVNLIKVSRLAFDPILHEGYKVEQALEPDIQQVQEKIRAADHLVFVYPLWQFMIPALLKGFMERTFTPGFAYATNVKNPFRARLLVGKSARLIQTMGMPAFIYRLVFMARGAKAFKNLLNFCGISPVKTTYFGSIDGTDDKKCQQYLKMTEELGRRGQ